MRGKGAGVFFSAFIFLMSVGVAHADPGFVIAESQVRATDTVHFSITGGEGHVTYEIEVAGRDVLKGSGDGAAVSGQFTMPDLGAGAKSVKVEADIKDSDDKTEVKRKLQYLGLALPVEPEPVPNLEPQPAAAAPQQTAAATPAPSSTPAAAAAPVPEPSRSTGRRASRASTRARVGRPPVTAPCCAAAEARRTTRGRRRRSTLAVRPRAPHRCSTACRSPGSENYVPDDTVHPASKKQPVHKPVFGSAVANRAGSEPAMAISHPGRARHARLRARRHRRSCAGAAPAKPRNPPRPRPWERAATVT